MLKVTQKPKPSPKVGTTMLALGVLPPLKGEDVHLVLAKKEKSEITYIMRTKRAVEKFMLFDSHTNENVL